MAAGAESSRAHGAGRRGVSKERAEALFDLLRDDLPEVDERSLKLNQHLPPAERERVVEFIAEVRAAIVFPWSGNCQFLPGRP
jgi:hypothetical protein|tara:strand:+ start:368 stop:616 length:249 start_codon:yes stop_codon:yes gene_type:complete